MGSENLNVLGEINDQFEGIGGAQKISVSHHHQLINGVESHKASDSFVVDIERFASHFATDKDINANSRITLQRSLSRKGSQQQRGGGGVEKKSITNDRENGSLAISPRVSLLHGGSTPEKPMVVGPTDHHTHNPQVHNPITIMTGSLAGGGAAAAAMAEGKGLNRTISRRSSFRRSMAFFDPRKILLFFATLSSMGTILLIYFTLSIYKLNGVDDGLN